MKIEKVSLVVPSEPDYIVMPLFKELKRYRKIAKDAYFKEIYKEHDIETFKPRNISFKPSIGVLYLASLLENKGIETNILHQDYLEYKAEWDAELEKAAETSDMMGFTSITVSYNNVVDSLKKIKEINPELLNIIGGPHVTYSPESALNDGFDAVIRGEGEETLDELVDRLRAGKNIEGIAGLSYKKNGKNIIVAPRDRMEGSKIPIPAYHLIPEEMQENMSIHLQTARGCPYSCNFCVENGKLVMRDMDAVIEDVEKIKKYTGNTIWIGDSLTGIPKKRTMELAQKLHESFPETSFFFQTRPRIMSAEMYEHMAKNNFLGIKFGLESLSDKTLEIMGKRQTYNNYLSELETIKNIFPIREANLLLGYPGETLKDAHQSLERLDYVLGEDLIQTVSCSIFTPYPGSDVSNDHNFTLNSKNFEHYITKGFPPNIHTKNLSEFEVYSLMLRTIALETEHLYRKTGLVSSTGFDKSVTKQYMGRRS